MSKKKKVAIIGGGASGLLCAIECAKNPALEVDVYEQNSKIGKKILVSGNGKCNITNIHASKDDYSSQNPEFVNFALKTFPFKAFEKFTSDIGLVLVTNDDGKVYPMSYEAKSVTSLLQSKALKLGVNIKTDTKIKSIKPLFKNYDNVVVACGSEAAPHLGGCGDGYSFAKEFGHNIIQTYPSLVGLELDSDTHAKMSGTKIEAEISLLLNNTKTSTYYGDVLFTTYGVSGLAILDISNEVSEALINYQKADIIINLLPKFTPQNLSNKLLKIVKNTTTLLEALHAILPFKIAKTILDDLQIPQAKTSKDTNTKDIKKVVNKIQNLRFKVTNTHGFRHAEVSGGGVDTTQIDPKTMKSLKQKGLYFCGEVLDVVGRRGGFNFAWAWASGYLVAQDISLSVNRILPPFQK